MMKISKISLFAAGVVSLLAFGTPVLADGYRGQSVSEIRNKRGELRGDYDELNRDLADLARLRRRGASRFEITRKQHEINDDYREIARDRRDLRDYFGNWRGNGYGLGNDGRFGNRYGWYRNDDRRWGWNYDRWSGRD